MAAQSKRVLKNPIGLVACLPIMPAHSKRVLNSSIGLVACVSSPPSSWQPNPHEFLSTRSDLWRVFQYVASHESSYELDLSGGVFAILAAHPKRLFVYSIGLVVCYTCYCYILVACCLLPMASQADERCCKYCFAMQSISAQSNHPESKAWDKKQP